jgi:hypothetical protein
MRNILYLLTIVFVCISCSKEETTQQYTTAIRNISDKPLKILVLGNGEGKNTPVYDTLVNATLNPGEITFKNNYKFASFQGMHNGNYFIDIYYTKIVFLDNYKGYICDINTNNNDLCFQDKISLINAKSAQAFNFENGVYYYDITQKNYENAHVLP